MGNVIQTPHTPLVDMSFSRLHNDNDTYAHDIKQSIGPGNYMMDRVRAECKRIFVPDPAVRLGAASISRCEDKYLIDVDSELMGITRRASMCPTNDYIPGKKPICRNMPLQMGSTSTAAEDTRLSNPPCTLRGGENGFNRWEALCMDPQQGAIAPFSANINYRLVVKDNHRPPLDCPMPPTALPPGVCSDTMVEDLASNAWWCKRRADTRVPNLSWKRCDELYV